MKKRRIAVFISIIIIVALAVAYMGYQRRNKLPDIKTVKVTRADIQTMLSTNAMIQSKKTKSYVGQTQLKVKSVNAEVGQKVKKGEILLTYDVADLEFSVRQAEIQYENAVLNREELLNQKDRIEKEIIELDEQIFTLDGSSNPQDIATIQQLIQKRKSIQEISKEKIKLADNSVALAELTLKSARDRLKDASEGIVSEFDGVVTAVNAVEGVPLTMSQPAFVVQQLDNLKGIIRLGKYDAAKIRVGQRVTLSNGSNTYDGVVSFVEPSAKKDMGMASDATLQAEIDIKNPDAQLKVDFDINADILIDEAKNVLTLPIECIQFNRDKTTVFVVREGAARLVDVILGLQSDTAVEIKEGLNEGDIVIANPSIEIKDGTVVTKEGIKK